MKISSEELLSKIPTFDEFMALSAEIGTLMYRKMKLDAEIKAKESENFLRIMTDEAFFINGKPPSATHVESAYRFPGISGELLPMRLELAEVTSELEKSKIKMDIWKTMVDVWRTVSASERSSSI